MLQEITNTRRKFIKQAALASSMLALMASCWQTSKLFRVPIGSDALKKFKTNFNGHVILPGDAEYEKNTFGGEQRLQKETPTFIFSLKFYKNTTINSTFKCITYETALVHCLHLLLCMFDNKKPFDTYSIK